MGFEKKTVQRKDFSAHGNFSGSKAIQKKSAVGVIQKAGAVPEELPGAVTQQKSDTVQKVEEMEEPGPSRVSQSKASQKKPVTNHVPLQRKENKTGMPDNLKSGIENLSGMSMDHVKVHYNSSQPAQLNALAYAQGSDIHVGPGQEKHLPHEAWHVVQQAQGRVQPTAQAKMGVAVNDDPGLEHEADVMGAKAMSASSSASSMQLKISPGTGYTAQLYTYGPSKTQTVNVTGSKGKASFEECTYNSVTFNKNDKLPGDGTGTTTADWAGWLKNIGNDNNATQLHVVNKIWGGKGGPKEGNIVPGTPSLNSHHLHEAEKLYKAFFPSGVSTSNCKYECFAKPKYSGNVDVSKGILKYADPDLTVVITNFDTNKIDKIDITPGGGLYFTDGS